MCASLSSYPLAARMRAVAVVVLLIPALCSAFYLPGVAPVEYQEGKPVSALSSSP